MADEKISINIGKMLAIASAVASIAIFALLPSIYTAPLVFTVLLLVWGSYYVIRSKEKMSEMCCMMSGMAYGMMSGFFVGAIVGLATADFLVGMVFGTIAGIIFGIPVGRVGGPLGRMEGVMAGPMGGIMGGMTGVMVQFFSIGLFMPFLVIIAIFTVWEMTRVVHIESNNISRKFIYLGILISLLAFSSTLTNDYSIAGTGAFLLNTQTSQQPAEAAPVNNGVQEINIRMTPLAYEPNHITVKKNVPVKLTLTADSNAGCTRSFVFPEFNIRKTVARGGTETVQFTPTETGTFGFSCTMAMARGTLVVQ